MSTPTMKVAGVEYGQECYCASNLPSTATKAANSSSGCDMPCSGNRKEFCGGSSLLNVYVYNATSVSAQGVPATGSQS